MNKSKLPKNWTFDDRKYKIIWKKPRDTKEMIKAGLTIHGDCADPKSLSEDRTIRISPHGSVKDVATILVHEAIHAEFWDYSEEAVERVSSNLIELLDRCGFLSTDFKGKLD